MYKINVTIARRIVEFARKGGMAILCAMVLLSSSYAIQELQDPDAGTMVAPIVVVDPVTGEIIVAQDDGKSET